MEICEGCGKPVLGPEMYAQCGRCAAVGAFKWMVAGIGVTGLIVLLILTLGS